MSPGATDPAGRARGRAGRRRAGVGRLIGAVLASSFPLVLGLVTTARAGADGAATEPASVHEAGLAQPSPSPGASSAISLGPVEAAGGEPHEDEPVALSASVINAGSEPAIQVKVTFLGAAGGEEPQPVASGVVDVAPGASAIAAGAWTPDRGGAWRVSAALDDASAVGPPTQILVVAATTGEDAVAAAQHLTTGVVVSALVLLAIGAAFMARTGTTVFRS